MHCSSDYWYYIIDLFDFGYIETLFKIKDLHKFLHKYNNKYSPVRTIVKFHIKVMENTKGELYMKKFVLLTAAVLSVLFVCAACAGRNTATRNDTAANNAAVDTDERENGSDRNNDLNNDHIEDPTEYTTDRLREDTRDLGDKAEDAAKDMGEDVNEAMEDVSEALNGREDITTAKQNA